MTQKPYSLRHDLRVPYSTLLGVVSALQDEPDMSPEDRKEFLAILEREIHTSMGLTDDLHTLLVRNKAPFSTDLTNAIDAHLLVEEIREKVLPNRSLPADLTLDIQARDGHAKLRGDGAMWKLIATKLLDHGLAHSRVPGSIQLQVSQDAVELVVADSVLPSDEADGLKNRLPQRAQRHLFNPDLGMGAFLAFRIAELHDLTSDLTYEGESLRIRIFRSSMP